ncbi:MAG TPA: pilus assembly protein TadG-related protein [Gemmataceae bacterium]|nr:pilus assembly protein TadG-related protein [Gemmataceae bacterium]
MCSSLLPRPMPRRRGAVTPLTVLSLSLLVGVVAMAVDSGTLMEARRHVQATADAAALAGASDLYTNYLSNQGIDSNGTALKSAQDTASSNGFANDGVQSTVTVRTSPQTYVGGPNQGKALPAGYIEVTIQYNASHLFSGVFGSGTTPVRARAVARGRCAPLAATDAFALNLKASAALKVSNLLGGLAVNTNIQANSKSSTAVQVSGLAKITTPLITLNPNTGGLIGSILSFLLGIGGSTPTVTTCLPLPDPLRYLPVPDPVSLGLTTQGTNLTISSGNVDLYPGVYNGGIQISGTANVTLHANSDGTPGIYYLNGSNGFTISGSASVKTASSETAGIMIYNNWSSSTDAINISSSGTITITPPASGIYRGLSIFQKRGTLSSAGPTMSINGQANTNVTGTIYAAHASVSLTASSSTNVSAGQIIADTISVSGLATLNINPGSQPTANARILGLVE